jgi:hypothetical protein
MKQPEDSWQKPDPRRRAPPALTRSPEPETRELDAAEIARLVAHPASAPRRPAEWRRSGPAPASAQPLPRPAAAPPPGMPVPPGSGPRRDSPSGRAPKRGPGAEGREVELSDLYARRPKPWSDQAPRRPPADQPAAQPPAERQPTGSKRWRTPVDPPVRDLTLRLSPEAIRAAYPHRDPHVEQSRPSSRRSAGSEPLASKRPALGRRIAIGVLATLAPSIFWLGPRWSTSTTAAADRVATLPTAAVQAPMNPSVRTDVTDIPPRPAVTLSAPPSPRIATAVDADPAPRHPRTREAAAPKPGPREPGSRAAASVDPFSSAAATAIEQLARGHQREALAAYLQLAAAQPKRPAYAAIARILRDKLRLRCAGGNDSLSTACQETSP